MATQPEINLLVGQQVIGLSACGSGHQAEGRRGLNGATARVPSRIHHAPVPQGHYWDRPLKNNYERDAPCDVLLRNPGEP